MLCCAQSCLTLCDPHGLLPTRLLCPWGSPGKNTGVGCHALLQGPLHCRWFLYHLSHQGSHIGHLEISSLSLEYSFCSFSFYLTTTY